MRVDNVDKVTQAERKLAGLCELCGCEPQPRHRIWEGCAYKKGALKIIDHPDNCLDKMTYYGK